MRFRRKISAAFVDPACLLDGSHPLNSGLVGEWSVIPNSGWSRGLVLYDLMRGLHNPNPGTLTNGPTWVGSKGRPGGFGGVSYVTASNQYAACGSGPVVGFGAINMTVAAWINTSQAWGNICSCLGAGFAGFEFSVSNGQSGTSASDGQVSLYNGSGWTNTTARVDDGLWHHVAVTNDGTNSNFYIDGALSRSVAHTNPNTPAGVFQIGLRPSTTGIGFQGIIDGVMLWKTVVLSPSAIAALYAETRRGNPERWRWVSNRSWVIPTGVATNRVFVPGVVFAVRS